MNMDIEYPVTYSYKEAETDNISMSRELLDRIYASLYDRDTEQGGIVGRSAPGRLSRYYHDEDALCHPNQYLPSDRLTLVVSRWMAEGIMFAGFIHTHPPGHHTLSLSDQLFVRGLLAENRWLPSVLMGILAGKELFFYRFDRDFLEI